MLKLMRTLSKNYEAEEYINRIKSYMQSKYIDEDFGRQLVEKKLNEMEMAPSDLDTSRINRAIGGGAIEGEDLGTREGFQDPKIEFHRSKGVLGNLNYGFDNLSKDLKAGKTTNQIANELYEKNKNFPEKFKTDRIQKLNPVVLVESALKERVTKQPDFLKLSNKNKEVFNSKKEKALKDFNSFIENNKSKYKKMYDQNIAGAPEKFKQDLKSFLEKKYPEFIKESGGSTFVTKGTKLFIPIKDLGREVTQAGDYGIEKYINNTIRESLGIPLKPKAGEGSSLDRLQRKYNLSTQKLLDAAKKQGIIPEKDPITGNPINSESAYYRYVKRTEVDPIYKLFDKRFKFGGEHLGGISRAFNIGDTEALTKITAIDPYVNRVVKGGNLDKKVSTQINLAKQTGNKKYLNIANDLIKQGEKDFGLQLTKYKFKDNKIVAVHPKVSMDDPIVKKAERAILSFIATGRDKTKNFELLPEELKQSIQLFKENNLPKARKFLNQAIKTGKVASVVGIAGLASLETQAEAAGEETKTGSILPSDTYPSAPPSVLNKKEETNLNLPPEAALAGAATYKYGPQLLKILKSLGSGAFRTFGSPLVSSLYGASEILDYDPKNEYGIINPRNYKVQEDPDVRMAGLSLLLPDIAQKVTGPAATSAATGIKGFLSKAGRVALNPYFKAARLFTPVGLGIAGVGQAYDFYKQYQDLQKLKEEDPEAYEKFRRSRVDDEITAQEISTIEDMGREGAMYGGRVGFADGPKDPGKRKTMKILAGLGSLPILGRFFDVAQVAEKAAPAVVETFKNAPAHFIGLVNKIRALGRIIDLKKFTRSEQEKFSNVYDYGDYRMYEKLDGGVEIQKEKFMGTYYGDAKVSEEYMSYNPKTPKFNKKGEKIPDEYEEVYEEYTAYPDSEGKMKDIYESVEPNTIDEGTYSKEELEQLIVEQIEDSIKKGKK
jgi:hypothetical protein